MRIKKLCILLLCGVLLTGCGGKKDGASNGLTQNDLMKETTATPVPTQPAADKVGDNTEEPAKDDTAAESGANVDEHTGTAEDNTDAVDSEEQEPYILTFEANTVNGEAWNSDKIAESKLTMINVWATYCNPCLSEMPDLGEIAAEYDSTEFQLIGIVSDVIEGDSEEAMAEAKALIEETKADYPHLVLNESLYSNLVGAVSAVPTTFFVNQKKELLGYVTGAQTKETWVSLIEQLLSEME